MKKIIIFLLMFILLVPIALPQGSGSGERVLTLEEFYEMSDDFTKCLIDNCDYFCKRYGLDIGYYYTNGKCWCESYIKTVHGDIKSDDGWIEIDKCSQKEINIEPDVTKQKKLLIIIIMFLILLLGAIAYYLNKK